MLTGDAYSPRYLVPSYLGLAYALLVETNLFSPSLSLFFRTMLFKHPSVLFRLSFHLEREWERETGYIDQESPINVFNYNQTLSVCISWKCVCSITEPLHVYPHKSHRQCAACPLASCTVKCFNKWPRFRVPYSHWSQLNLFLTLCTLLWTRRFSDRLVE